MLIAFMTLEVGIAEVDPAEAAVADCASSLQYESNEGDDAEQPASPPGSSQPKGPAEDRQGRQRADIQTTSSTAPDAHRNARTEPPPRMPAGMIHDRASAATHDRNAAGEDRRTTPALYQHDRRARVRAPSLTANTPA